MWITLREVRDNELFATESMQDFGLFVKRSFKHDRKWPNGATYCAYLPLGQNIPWRPNCIHPDVMVFVNRRNDNDLSKH